MASSTQLYFSLLVIGLSVEFVSGTGVGSLLSFPNSAVRPSSFGSPLGDFGSSGGSSASTQTDNEKFEAELQRGGCRKQLTNTLKAKINQIIVIEIPATQLPMDAELRETLSDRAGKALENAIEENATGGNAADATATGFIVACSSDPELMPACMAAKPLVRKAALESILVLCRTSECCKKSTPSPA